MVAKLWWALIRFGFRLLYNELAFTYDLVAWVVSFGQWRAWQRAAMWHLNATTADTVLELAHGPGNLQLDLRRRGYRTVGLDLSPHMGRIARGKLRRHGFFPRLVRGSALALPFPAGRFATIVSTFPTEFIFEAATVREVWRVLKPGGRLVVCATGRITAKGVCWQLLELAYRVTGQRPRVPVEPIFAQFSAAGLEPRFVAQRVGAGEVWLLIAEKPEVPRFTWKLT